MFKIIIIIFIGLFQISFLSCTKSTGDNISKQSSQNSSKEKVDLNNNIHDLSVKTMNGEDRKLSNYKGKVLMIVNVASKCGYTKQYEGLEAVYRKYKERGFEILAFPCNDFKGQEPGTNDEILAFCKSEYNVTFELFDKIKVLGDSKSQLYERLINNSEPTGDIGWNFEKFFINKDGNIVARFKSKITPESEEITQTIETELSK